MSGRVKPQVTPFARRVLDLVDQVPSGRVTTYGDVAEILGEGGARGVGAVMARWGDEVPWWRVIRSDGTPAPHVAEKTFAILRKEKVPLHGSRVDLATVRWEGPDDLV